MPPNRWSPIQELLDQKNTVLTTLRQRMEQGAKAAGVQRINGLAKFLSTNEVEVSTAGNKQRMKADFVILATGSSPIVPSLFPKHPAIFTSDSIFSMDYLPAHLVVVGAATSDPSWPARSRDLDRK